MKAIIKIGASAAIGVGGALLMALPASALVNTTDIADGAVISAKIANYTIGGRNLGSNSVGTRAISDYSIGGHDLGDNSVGSRAIAEGSVQTADLASNVAVASDITRATGDTGSLQNLAGDLTLTGAAGSSTSTSPKFQAGVMGNLHGDSLTATANYNGGVIGDYSVTGTDNSTYPKGGVLGLIGSDGASSTADGAFVAVIDGDGGVVTGNAAYGVDYLNSTPGSKFTYGLDLKHAAHDGYAAVTYGTADIRLASGTTIASGSSNPGTCVKGSINLNTADGKLYVCSATDTWVVAGSQS